MAPSEAERLASVRTRIAAFDYHDQLGAESLDLVERLFGDLVTTTEVSIAPYCLHGLEQLSGATRNTQLCGTALLDTFYLLGTMAGLPAIERTRRTASARTFISSGAAISTPQGQRALSARSKRAPPRSYCRSRNSKRECAHSSQNAKPVDLGC